MKTLYRNGTILTMEPNLRCEAVLEEDGRILATGKAEELAPLAKDAKVVDLDGCTMLPAFIDAHSHFSGAANGLLQVPLAECISWEEIQDRIRDFIAQNHPAKDTWVIANGYDHNALKEHRHPTADILTQAAPEHPVVIQHKSGHMGVMNHRALELLGITAQTPSPEGGLIAKEAGRLTGYLEETAFVSYLKKIPMPDMSALMDAFGRVQQQYASYGVATLQEGMLVKELVPLYRKLLAERRLYLDVVGYADCANADELYQALPSGAYQDHFRLGGCKIFLDGSPQGRTAWMRTPYDGQPDYTGYGTMRDEQVRQAVEDCICQGRQVLAHCNGDAAAAQYLAALKQIPEERLAKARPVIVHGQLLGVDQLPQVKAVHAIPSFFVAHVYHWGDVHIENFGMKRACSISPAKSALELGIPFTFHQDTPVLPPNMLETVWCACNRMTRAGVCLGMEQRIDVLSALKAVTIQAAYQYFEEDQKGSIRAGKQADFVILSKDPLCVQPEDISGIQVLETIKSGKTVYQKER